MITSDWEIYVRMAERFAPGRFKQRIINGAPEKLAKTVAREGATGFVVHVPDSTGHIYLLKIIPLSE